MTGNAICVFCQTSATTTKTTTKQDQKQQQQQQQKNRTNPEYTKRDKNN